MLLSTGAEGELPHTVVIDFEEVVYVDTTGAAALTGFFAYAQRYGVELSLARVHSGAHRLLQVTGVMDEIGEHRIHHTVRNAVDAATASATADASAASKKTIDERR
jgi:anti-anti-sigma regulatory factor